MIDAYDIFRSRALARLRGEPDPLATNADAITAAMARVRAAATAERAEAREVEPMLRRRAEEPGRSRVWRARHGG